MGNYVNVGNAGFAAALRETYVDKTGLIAFINSTLGTKSKLTCVSRPRRFGKSYAAQMLCTYYDKSCDSSELLEIIYERFCIKLKQPYSFRQIKLRVSKGSLFYSRKTTDQDVPADICIRFPQNTK